MNRLHILLSALNIRSGEGRLVGLMLVYALFMGIPGLITETTAYTLFLVEFDAQAIPYIYIGFTVVTTLSGFIYTKLEKRISFSKFVTLNLAVLMLALCLLRLLLWLTEAKWPVVALTIWYESSWALANLGFWSLAGHLFNVRQGKRLFALIGIGLTLSESVIGFFIPTLVGLISTPNLLLVAAAGFAGALVVQSYILSPSAGQSPISGQEDEEKKEESEKSFVDLIKNHYIVLIFALAALYALAFYVLDNAFYARVETQYPDADQLASFIGVFFAVTGLLTLAIGAFISGQVISRYGVRVGLLAMPVILIVGTLSVAVVGSVSKVLIVLFWLVTMTKLFNEVLAYTINRAAWQVLYEPLPANQRLRAQTVVESMVKPIAGGLAGVILLVFNTFFEFEAVQLASLLLFILAAWLGVVVMLNRAYPVMLLHALAKRRLSDTSLTVAGRSSIAVLKQGLTSPHVRVVIYALDMLKEIEPESFPTYLQDLLDHPVAEIRLEALRRIERFGVTSAMPAVRQRIKHETSASVRGVSLRTLTALGGPQVFEEVYAYLEDPDPQVRRGAMVGLLRNRGPEGARISAIGEKLIELLNSSDPTEREFVARVIGEAGIDRFYRPLLKLLRDDKLQVQRAALIAAGKLKNPQLWPAVIERLASPKVRARAVTALVAGGESVLPELKATFAKAGQEREILVRLAGICGRIRGPNAVAILQDKLDFPDEQVRSHILMALSQCGYRAEDEDRVVIRQKIKTEIAQATRTLATLVDMSDTEAVSLLKTTLNNNLARHRARLFLLLSFIYDPQSILRVRDTLDLTRSSAGKILDEKKAYALEIIDVLVSSDLRGMLIPLLDELTPTERLQRLSAHFPQQSLRCHERLQEIITGPKEWLNPWTKTCALYTAAQLSAVELTETVVSALSAPEPLIRETAVWTLFRLDPGLYGRYAGQLAQDPNPQVARTAIWLKTEQGGDKIMLSWVEKVILLKAVAFFSETPEEVLAAVASILEELEIKRGETIIEKDEPGSSMYIVVDGQVRVHDEGRTIIELGESDIFGEMSILDPGPRLASVTALTDTRLLRLDQEPFYELIDDHSTIGRRIMQILVQHLRRAQAQIKPDRPTDDLLRELQEELTRN